MTTPVPARPQLIGRHAAIYALGTILGMSGSIILLPIVTRALGPAAYGALELFNRTADLAVLVALLGMRQSFIRYFYEHDTSEWRAQVASTVFAYAILVGVVALIIGVFVGAILPPDSVTTEFGAWVGLLVGLSVAVQLVFQITTVYLQVQQESTKFVLAQLAMMVLYVGAAVIALYVFEAGVVGVVLAHTIASTVVASVCGWYLVSRSGLSVNRAVFRSMVAFGIPFLPTAMFSFVVSSADRYVLAVNVSLEDVGIYSLAAKIASVSIALVSTPLGRVWAPFAFHAARLQDGQRVIGQGMFAYILVVSFAALGVVVLTPLVIPLLAPVEFQKAALLVPLFCLFEILIATANVADVGILIAKRTWLKPAVYGTAALVTVGGLFVLVPAFGVTGAISASVLGALALLAINLAASNYCYRIVLPMRNLLVWVIVAGMMLVFISWMQSSSIDAVPSTLLGLLTLSVLGAIAAPSVVAAYRGKTQNGQW